MPDRLKMQYPIRLIDLQAVSETDAVKAMISAFTPCFPGAHLGFWKKRAWFEIGPVCCIPRHLSAR